MNRYLLDTHAFLWIVQRATAEVSASFFTEVERWQRDRVLFLSPVSAWEIGLLLAAGQIQLGMSPDRLWAHATENDGLGVLAAVSAHPSGVDAPSRKSAPRPR